MDISNKTLALFLLGAIVVSLGGTILSLNKLGDLTTTGFVTGNVTLLIDDQLSITTEDRATINFGTCTPFPSVAATINSEDTANTSICVGSSGLGAEGGIFVRNNGNVDARVTLQASDHGAADNSGTFLDSTSGTSSLQYRTTNDGHSSGPPYTGGCTGMQGSYTAIDNTTDGWLVCNNLTFGSTANSVQTRIQIVVPHDVAPGSDLVTLTFTAAAAS